MMNFKSILFTLRAKLVMLFLVLALVPLGLIGAFSITITEELIVNLVLRQLENVAADKAAILERWLGERKADLRVIAGTSLLKSMQPDQIAPYLDLIQKQYGVYDAITVLTPDNQRVYSTQPRAPLEPLTPTSPETTEGELYLSNIIYRGHAKESFFHIAAPIFDEDHLRGRVYGTVGTHNILVSIIKVSLGLTGECYLVDKNGTFLAHKEPNRILKENISQSESFKNIFGGPERKRIYLDYRGIEVLGTFQKVSGTDWYLVVEQDRDEAFQSADALKRYIFLTVLLCIGSTLVITWVFSFHVARPIRTLSRWADTLADAHPADAAFDQNIPGPQRRDEIGMLHRAFSNMARKVSERQHTLEHDITLKDAALKETDLILKQIKVIAERSEKFAAIGRLGAAVAHEIRTPLTSLKLFLESVESDIKISPEYEEDFVIAMDQVQRIEAAINHFLDFSKPQELTLSKVDIIQLIEDVVFMIRPMAAKQDCQVKIDLDEALPEIPADKKFLEEALINLLINALEAIAGPGKITVSATRDDLQGDGASQDCIRIDVGDSGSGIAPEHLGRIFDPFFTTKSAGTGLGLPLVLNTIKRHGGDVRVQSHADSGTVFSLFLPTAETNG
jgi:signal transduction histidine kinase